MGGNAGRFDTKSFRYKSFRYTPKSVRYKDIVDSIQPQLFRYKQLCVY